MFEENLNLKEKTKKEIFYKFEKDVININTRSRKGGNNFLYSIN